MSTNYVFEIPAIKVKKIERSGSDPIVLDPIQIPKGAGEGKVLVSNENGVASWGDSITNGTGTITRIETWFYSSSDGLHKVGMFYGSGAVWTSRTTGLSLGNITGGSKKTFTGLSIACQTGDVIGMYGETTGSMEVTNTGGAGGGYISPKTDPFTMTAKTFSLYATRAYSLKGIGETVSGIKPQILVCM